MSSSKSKLRRSKRKSSLGRISIAFSETVEDNTLIGSAHKEDKSDVRRMKTQKDERSIVESKPSTEKQSIDIQEYKDDLKKIQMLKQHHNEFHQQILRDIRVQVELDIATLIQNDPILKTTPLDILQAYNN